MKTTSHFMGLSLDSSHFADLFVSLQQYFKSHDIESVIEFQNILTTHITLYYLESTISVLSRFQPFYIISNMLSIFRFFIAIRVAMRFFFLTSFYLSYCFLSSLLYSLASMKKDAEASNSYAMVSPHIFLWNSYSMISLP
ncbi:MAG TPA: hypothetical protein PLT04_02360, partial [Candidatus Saccharibacteria bacterium]|nr:hypothetical protein [Candidatus Saccharibacteria bacterium]